MFSSFISIWFDWVINMVLIWVCVNAGDFVVLRIDDSRNCTDVSLANRGERPSIVPKPPAAIVSFEMLKGAIGSESPS